MGKKYIMAFKDAATGVLHGKAGTFRIFIDEESSGTPQGLIFWVSTELNATYYP